MAENTSIEWCDHTFNPWIGCTRVSIAATGGGGCDNCYAAVSTPARAMKISWGAKEPRHRTAPATWAQPLKWNAAHEAFYAAHGRRQRVFCASLADVFDNEVDIQWRADLFELIKATPNLDWLILTKRIGNVLPMAQRFFEWIPNAWLGATVVNQEEADRDIPKLLAIPARVRFLSCEPLLGPVNLWLPTRLFMTGRGPFGKEEPIAMCDHCCNGDRCDDPTHYERGRPEWRVRCPHCRGTGRGRPIDWVICGGESGREARPMHPDWARSLRDQCAAAGVPFLFKQWGEWGPDLVPPVRASYRWPDRADGTQAWSYRVGKKAAGRLLDGVEHNSFPEA